ncbi:MAG: hypothetical protein KatS3mg095_0344 [Candidatus Parcubacteria bacterium]|nr:MAG: hypothetical protein KatS3mg095_0344 [Candidatus Parcubacteria bacterium]
MTKNILNYIKESFNELKKINWLSLTETINLTLNIILFVIVFALIYWLFDFILLKIIFIR